MYQVNNRRAVASLLAGCLAAACGAGEKTGAMTVHIYKSGAGNGTVFSDPQRIQCGSLCDAIFNDGETVKLSATPEPGNTFEGWLGDCSGLDCLLDFAPGVEKTAIARFKDNQSQCMPTQLMDCYICDQSQVISSNNVNAGIQICTTDRTWGQCSTREPHGVIWVLPETLQPILDSKYISFDKSFNAWAIYVPHIISETVMMKGPGKQIPPGKYQFDAVISPHPHDLLVMTYRELWRAAYSFDMDAVKSNTSILLSTGTRVDWYEGAVHISGNIVVPPGCPSVDFRLKLTQNLTNPVPRFLGGGVALTRL